MVPCSPFLQNATLREHFDRCMKKDPEVCAKLISCLYADDANAGGYSDTEVLKLYDTSKQIIKGRNFNLRKWFLNSEEVRSYNLKKESESKLEKPTKEITAEDDQSFAKATLRSNLEMITLKF